MPIVRGIFISLLTHLVLTWGLQQVPADWLHRTKSADPVEVQLISARPNSIAKEQVVRFSEAPDSQKTDDNSKADFLSEKRQRVLLQTKALESGLTMNRSQYKLERRAEPSKKVLDESSPVSVNTKRPVNASEQGQSTVGDFLPNDLAVGSFTALNTDRFQYYTFYARIEELVRFRWETNVKQAIFDYGHRNPISYIGNRDWRTDVTFVLNSEGRLIKAMVMKESGLNSFDLAAVEAFREVKIFPNPPQELVSSDGTIELKYGFNVRFNPMMLTQ